MLMLIFSMFLLMLSAPADYAMPLPMMPLIGAFFGHMPPADFFGWLRFRAGGRWGRFFR